MPITMDTIAPDTWGTIVSIKDSGPSVEITLDDVAGRRVRVQRLRPRQGLGELRIGAAVYLFGLECTGSGRGWNGRAFQPHAFHETGGDPHSRTAWTTAIFCGHAD
jgi:hypothetical protein